MATTTDFYDYKIGTKREIVTALKPQFGSNFPIEDLRNNVYVGLEYPMEPINYPGIYVTYTERELRNVGIGYRDIELDTDGTPRQYRHWQYAGTLHFNVVALSPLDRDRLASALINMLAFAEVMPEFNTFFSELNDADYVAVTLQTERLIPGGEQVTPAPWGDEDTLVHSVTYSVEVFGEFISDATTGGLIQINSVIVSPYLTGTPPPWTD